MVTSQITRSWKFALRARPLSVINSNPSRLCHFNDFIERFGGCEGNTTNLLVKFRRLHLHQCGSLHKRSHLKNKFRKL